MSASRCTWGFRAVRFFILVCFCGCSSSFSNPLLSTQAQAEALSHFSRGLLAEANGNTVVAFSEMKASLELDSYEETLYSAVIALAVKLGWMDDALEIAQQYRKLHPGALNAALLLAQIAEAAERPGDAQQLFLKAIESFPDHQETYLGLAQFQLSQNRPDDAIRTLESALQKISGNADLSHLLGTLIIARAYGDPDSARHSVLKGLNLLEKSLARDSSNPKRWQQIGYVYLSIDRIESAKAAFEKAREHMPADLELARQVLDLALQTGAIDQAIELGEILSEQTETDFELWNQYLIEKIPDCYVELLITHLEEKLQQKNPSVTAYIQLSSLYLDHNRPLEAETTLLRALKTYPDEEKLCTVLAYLRIQQQRFDEAYTGLSHVRENAADDLWIKQPFFAYNFIVAAQRCNHLAEAADMLTAAYSSNPVILNQYMQALLTGTSPISSPAAIELLNAFHRLNPKIAETLYYLSFLQAGEKKYKPALVHAQNFESLARNQGATNLLNGGFYYQYGTLYERSGQLENAEKQFLKAIDLGSPTTVAAAQNYIAYMWADLGKKLNFGFTLIQKALSKEPDNPAFIDTLGWIYYQQGRYPEALEQLKKASILLENDPSIWSHLGAIQQKLGDSSAARASWEKARNLAPDQPPMID